METLQKVCLFITIIGALVWGIIGIFSFNVVEYLFGINSLLSRIVYALVGICGLINLAILFSHIEKK